MRARLLIVLLSALTAAGGAAPVHAAPQSTGRAVPQASAWDERRIALPQIGSAAVFVPHAPTPHVVLLISGDAGWNAAMSGLARRVAAQAVVIGVSYPSLKRTAAREGGCWYTASDLELISHAAQKALNLPQYHPPALVGYGSGAAVVYAALAAAPAITFAGGVSLGFCPDLQIAREICSGDTWSPDYDEKKRVDHLPPSKTLPKDWYVMLGVPNAACPAGAARRFVAGMPKTHATEGVSFETALQDLWAEKIPTPPAAVPRSATTRELEADLQQLQLPLEFRWPSQLSSLLVFFSGDGGWASLDEAVAEHLAANGVGVVGVSSLRYFWQAKPPAQVADDIRQLVMVLARAGRPVLAGGFSFGAEVVPVALKAWPAADRHLLSGLVLIAPGLSASFEIDPLDWIRTPQENPATRIAPAVRELAIPALCLAGIDETDTPCALLAGAPGVKTVRLPGSHHFNSDYSVVAETVLDFVRAASAGKNP
jgi:type IV secretory pathway VirJ component